MENFLLKVVIGAVILGVAASVYLVQQDTKRWAKHVEEHHCVLVMRWTPPPLTRTVPDTEIIQQVPQPTSELWSCDYGNLWR